MSSAATSPGGPATRVAVIGLGFMGRTHLAAWAAAHAAGGNCPVVAVCDSRPDRRLAGDSPTGNLALNRESRPLVNPASLRVYSDPREVLADREVDLVSICTPTESHVELTLAALAAGKHVLVEKPLALSSAECRRVVKAASSAATLCMPAFCMRFWPGWGWLRERIVAGEFGSLRSLVLQRLGTTPAWSAFYADAGRSGGALIDLHIHDADFVQWCLGAPERVVSAGHVHHMTTHYRFAAGRPPHVVAEGAWDHTPGFPFTMRYVAVFENATADFDLSREAPLMLSRDARREPVKLPGELTGLTGYDVQARHLLDAIAGRCPLQSTPADAEAVARLLEAESRSLASGTAERVEPPQACTG